MSNVPRDSPTYNRWQDQALLEGPQTRRRDLGLILRSLRTSSAAFERCTLSDPA